MWCCWGRAAAPVEELQLTGASLKHVPQSVPLAGRTLERLHLARNRLRELAPALFVCKELRLLDLADNELVEVPAAVQALAQLRRLDLARNALADLPLELKALRQLRFLDLSANPLDRLPESVCSLVSLEQLHLNDAGLEFLPANFGRLSSLRVLELRDNCLAMLPKSLARAADLERLDVGQNEFSEFPAVAGEFRRVRELWIDCNGITEIPAAVGNLVEMVHFDAGENAISELAPEISECVRLVDVCLSSNALAALPESIGSLVNLVSLKLDSNKLEELPDSIGNLASLEELILTTNYLRELPRTIGRLGKLQCLNVDQNYLRTVPKELGGCSSLTVLSLRSNCLTHLPEEIGRLAQLKVLNLVRNSLQNLPHALLNCEHLAALWLSENQSKPLVPMQSEMDRETGRRVLTCILFPQIDSSHDAPVRQQSSFESDGSAGARHISFVDVKTAAREASERPGNLRRAPTPYPKELRALAKHVRSNQRDAGDEPTMRNAVHIKAARVASTLRQRFADDRPVAEENPYDKPADLESDESYRRADRAPYSESADSAYGGYGERVEDEPNPYETRGRRNSIEERVNDIICQSSHDLYVSSERLPDARVDPVEAPYDASSRVDLVDRIYRKGRPPLADEYSSARNVDVDRRPRPEYDSIRRVAAYVRPEDATYEIHNENYYDRYAGLSPVGYVEYDRNLVDSGAGSVRSDCSNPNDYNYRHRRRLEERQPENLSSHRSAYGHVQNSSPRYVSYGDRSSEYNANVAAIVDPRRQTEPPAEIPCAKINPPPYHIAAAYSKQAQYFNGNN